MSMPDWGKAFAVVLFTRNSARSSLPSTCTTLSLGYLLLFGLVGRAGDEGSFDAFSAAISSPNAL